MSRRWRGLDMLLLTYGQIYLDRYFRDPMALLRELNAQVALYNPANPPRPVSLSPVIPMPARAIWLGDSLLITLVQNKFLRVS